MLDPILTLACLDSSLAMKPVIHFILFIPFRMHLTFLDFRKLQIRHFNLRHHVPDGNVPHIARF